MQLSRFQIKSESTLMAHGALAYTQKQDDIQ